MKNCEIIINKNWKKSENPFITIVTPLYNRRKVLKRAINSVNEQTFRNIEYIIVDDGSTDMIDDIVEEFMNSTDLPVMFIKKANGGVHTARNAGYGQARGKLTLCIDSDDELLPEACMIFYDTWLSIPDNKKEEYWQIKAQCIDQNGKIAGIIFPDGINKMPNEEARKYFSMAKGDQVNCCVTEKSKKYLLPEPEGVTFVTENIKLIPLERKYRSWGINDIVRIYHTEGDDHLSRAPKKKTRQELRNMLWNTVYKLNDSMVFGLDLVERLKGLSKYCVAAHLLKWCGDKDFVEKYMVKGHFNIFWKNIFWLPSAMVALFYRKKNFVQKEVNDV